ncbi:LicD family-domain-containing protein [Daldinia caldariorum]|uniref:LicD family-domain-containing protein n=1 Tax=Daldinia caldariorum TaxID=326644 RepID=UPI002008CB27|nr:LicD family-domain-containing protein [Daldinia caldariorum]KAI1471436.1 LicD family-domain-containing protein [Daldinia caldariorum]
MRLLLVLLMLFSLAASPSSSSPLPAKPKKLAGGKSTQSKFKFKSDNNNNDDDDDNYHQHQQHHDPKYFHEAGGTMELGHYDARFFRGEVGYGEHGAALRRLIRAWLATTRELGVDTWLAHGTLLGWWWNGRVMPWDYDLDVQMPTATLTYLGRHFNRTLHDYRFLVRERGEDGGMGGGGGGEEDEDEEIIPGSGNSESESESERASSSPGSGLTYINKTYLLDVNPHHTELTRGNGANVIDARWIDVGTGLFVDITGLAERDAAGAPGVWSCKNAHRYRTREIYPVRRTQFEGVPALVPFAFDKILTDEYGAKSLVNTEWAGHRWVPELKEWVKKPPSSPNGKGKGKGKGKQVNAVTKQQQEQQQEQPPQDGNAVVVVVEKTVVKGAQ